jgi:glycosidase
VTRHGQVLYELHVGTFTPEGTWRAAAARLPHLAEVGVTCVEMMPVNEFPGDFGWGYDGVNLFAPYHRYGEPDDLRAFVDEAHRHGIGVILDVVYNHLGPGGDDLLQAYSPDYFNERYDTDWGEALNFDGPNCGPAREWVVANGSTGSPSTASTASGSTPPRTSTTSTRATSTSWPSSPAPRATPRRRTAGARSSWSARTSRSSCA